MKLYNTFTIAISCSKWAMASCCFLHLNFTHLFLLRMITTEYLIICDVFIYLSRATGIVGYTNSTTGCQCWFNESQTDCACCNPGGCQCGVSNRQLCVECGRDENCVVCEYYMNLTIFLCGIWDAYMSKIIKNFRSWYSIAVPNISYLYVKVHNL